MRRAVAALALLALVAAPAAWAQGGAARVGLLGPDEEPRFSDIARGLKQGMGEQGYPESRIEIVALRVARESVPALPIVFLTPGDPAAAGLVASLARPGRNMTALTWCSTTRATPRRSRASRPRARPRARSAWC